MKPIHEVSTAGLALGRTAWRGALACVGISVTLGLGSGLGLGLGLGALTCCRMRRVWSTASVKYGGGASSKSSEWLEYARHPFR